jgi:hypothetical protein
VRDLKKSSRLVVRSWWRSCDERSPFGIRAFNDRFRRDLILQSQNINMKSTSSFHGPIFWSLRSCTACLLFRSSKMEEATRALFRLLYWDFVQCQRSLNSIFCSFEALSCHSLSTLTSCVTISWPNLTHPSYTFPLELS